MKCGEELCGSSTGIGIKHGWKTGSGMMIWKRTR